jgi:hypothetical protein
MLIDPKEKSLRNKQECEKKLMIEVIYKGVYKKINYQRLQKIF